MGYLELSRGSAITCLCAFAPLPGVPEAAASCLTQEHARGCGHLQKRRRVNTRFREWVLTQSVHARPADDLDVFYTLRDETKSQASRRGALKTIQKGALLCEIRSGPQGWAKASGR